MVAHNILLHAAADQNVDSRAGKRPVVFVSRSGNDKKYNHFTEHYSHTHSRMGVEKENEDMTLDTVDPHLIIKSIKQKIYVKDIDGRYLWVNDSFASVAGLASDVIVGKSDDDMPWRGQAGYFREDDQLVLSGSPLEDVERYQHRLDGMTKIILNLTPYRNSAGIITGVVGNFFDVSHHFAKKKGVYTNNKFYLEFNNEYLTKTELIVTFLLFQGFQPDEIGERMPVPISLNTVRYHLDNIKVKMGCATIKEIQKVAIENGIFFHIFTLQHELD